MFFGERLDLDNELLKGLRAEIEVSLNAALMLADKEGKEVEVGLKIKANTETVREYKQGRVTKEWTEPRLSWVVTRKVKENKIDHKGSLRPGWELRFDEDGKPYVVEANQQATLFDEEKDAKTVIHYHFGEKKEAESEENTAMPPYAKEDLEVKENAEDSTDAALDDEPCGDSGESEVEQPDEAAEAADAEGEE